MANFLLIHGASHGAWCWDKIVPRLEKLGHTVATIDLPLKGVDPANPYHVTMNDYETTALAAMGPDTILVGHSLGGLTATLAAVRAPEKTSAIVYLCALVPVPGQAFTDFRAEAISPALGAAVTLDRETGLSHAIPDQAANLFYHDCSADDRAFALDRLSPQPVSVMTETLNFEKPSAPRHYIRCLDDRVVMPSYQMAVSEGWTNVYDMACGHSPFLSDPSDLTNILNDIAQKAA